MVKAKKPRLAAILRDFVDSSSSSETDKEERVRPSDDVNTCQKGQGSNLEEISAIKSSVTLKAVTSTDNTNRVVGGPKTGGSLSVWKDPRLHVSISSPPGLQASSQAGKKVTASCSPGLQASNQAAKKGTSFSPPGLQASSQAAKKGTSSIPLGLQASSQAAKKGTSSSPPGLQASSQAAKKGTSSSPPCLQAISQAAKKGTSSSPPGLQASSQAAKKGTSSSPPGLQACSQAAKKVTASCSPGLQGSNQAAKKSTSSSPLLRHPGSQTDIDRSVIPALQSGNQGPKARKQQVAQILSDFDPSEESGGSSGEESRHALVQGDIGQPTGQCSARRVVTSESNSNQEEDLVVLPAKKSVAASKGENVRNPLKRRGQRQSAAKGRKKLQQLLC